MKLNKEKLDQMVKVVMKEFVQKVSMFNYAEFELITRNALTPFCMEPDPVEICAEGVQRGFAFSDLHAWNEGAKFIRDGK